MKKDLHPTYGPVAFRDRSTGRVTVTRSTLASRPPGAVVEVDGTTYLPEATGLRIGDLVPAVVTGTDGVDLIAEEIR